MICLNHIAVFHVRVGGWLSVLVEWMHVSFDRNASACVLDVLEEAGRQARRFLSRLLVWLRSCFNCLPRSRGRQEW